MTATGFRPRLIEARQWPWLVVLPAFVFAALALSPMLASGFMGDDVINMPSTAPRTLQVHGVSLMGVIISNTVPWLQEGRFFPGMTYVGVLFYLVNGSAIALKLFVFGLILIDLALLGVLIALLTRSAIAAALSVVIVPIALQIRMPFYHDPVVGFAGLLPLISMYQLASLCLFAWFLRSRRRRYLVVSAVLYACGLVTYEITIAFVLVYPALAWLYPERRPLRRAFVLAVPFGVLAAFAVAIPIALRLANPGGFALSSSASDYARSLAQGADPVRGAYSPNFDLFAFSRALVLQCVGAIPFAYSLLASPMAKAQLPSPWDALAARPAFTLALGGASLVLVLAALRRARNETGTPRGPATIVLAFGMAIALIVLPNVLIALSPRYQRELQRGLAYLPVFMSYLGTAMLAGLVLYGLVTTLARQTRSRAAATAGVLAIAVVVTVSGVMNVEINRRSVESANEAVSYPRDVAAKALRAGLMDLVPSGSTVAYMLDSGDFIADFGGASVRAIWGDPVSWLPSGTPSTTGADGTVTYEVPDGSAVYYMGSFGSWPDNGYAFVGRIRRLVLGAGGSRSVSLDNVRVYLTDAPLATDAAPPLMGQRGTGITDLNPQVVGLNPADTDSVRSGQGWSLLQSKPGVEMKVWI